MLTSEGGSLKRRSLPSGAVPLETQEEQDRWLLVNKNAINAKIRRGTDQLDRGEGIPEDQLDAHLAKLKAQLE
jgi:hypothetical protein